MRNAIETMEVTNKALRDLIIAHRSDATLQLNPLSLKINGIVDAAVMGGVTNYEKVNILEIVLLMVSVGILNLDLQRMKIVEIIFVCVGCRNSASVVSWLRRFLPFFFNLRSSKHQVILDN